MQPSLLRVLISFYDMSSSFKRAKSFVPTQRYVGERPPTNGSMNSKLPLLTKMQNPQRLELRVNGASMGKQLTFCILLGSNNSIMLRLGLGNLCASYPTTCRTVHVLTWHGMQNIHRILPENDHQRRYFCKKKRGGGVRRPVTGPIILLGLGLSFQTSPTLCSTCTICRRTSSDEWTREPKMSIFDQNAKPPADISRGRWGYTRQTSGHSPPSGSKLLKYAWLRSHGSIGMQAENRGGDP